MLIIQSLEMHIRGKKKEKGFDEIIQKRQIWIGRVSIPPFLFNIFSVLFSVANRLSKDKNLIFFVTCHIESSEI